MTRFFTRTLLLTALVLLATCDDSTSPPVPASVTVSAPVTTLEALGQTVQLSAEVKDKKGRVISGAAVTWSSGDESVATVSETSGLVTAVGPGATSIVASADATSGYLTLVVNQKPAALEKNQGDEQDGDVGQQLSEDIEVRVVDAGGSPIPGSAVTFRVESGGGSVGTPVVPSGQDGVASVSWTLGTDADSDQMLRASVDTFAIRFSATAHPGPEASVEVAGGSEQTGLAFQILPDPLQARVTDQYGNPVPAVEVAWAPGGEFSGSLSLESSLTNADGLAEAAWTLGSMVGTQTAEASVGDLTPAFFSASVVAPPVSQIEITPGEPFVEVGTEIQLDAVATTAEGDTLRGVPFVWASSTPSVASVDDTGLVTGLSPGATTISATFEGRTGSVSILVGGVVQPTGIRVEAPDSVAPGESFTIQLVLNTGELSHAMGAVAMTLTWDPAVLTLDDPNGLSSDYLWKGLGSASGDQAGFVVSVPSGLTGQVTLLDIPMAVIGSSGGGSELLLTVDQAISAVTFTEIGEQLPGIGARVEVRTP